MEEVLEQRPGIHSIKEELVPYLIRSQLVTKTNIYMFGFFYPFILHLLICKILSPDTRNIFYWGNRQWAEIIREEYVKSTAPAITS